MTTDLHSFEAFPKIPRLRRDVVITEKIDGTNGAVVVTPEGRVYAQSRNRVVTTAEDHAGFGRWVADNADVLRDTLGVGRHFGEWWGRGIQRGYDRDRKFFSLFNASRWGDGALPDVAFDVGIQVVPVLLSQRPLSDQSVDYALSVLREYGSLAAPGFTRPEGIVVFHSASRQLFKVLLEGDESPKGAAA